MRLLRYRVTNFRSVADSDWVDTDDVATLIGVNEPGKPNLLLPLSKLKPARGGGIRPASDYPKTMFAEIRENPARFRFISAEFVTEALGRRIANIAGITAEEAEVVRVDRYFNGAYIVSFPRREHPASASSDDIAAILNEVNEATAEICAMPRLAKEETQKADLISGLQTAALDLPDAPISADALSTLAEAVRALAPATPATTSSIFPRLEALAASIDELQARVSAPNPGATEAVRTEILKRVPKFVYYSNYGNLDSGIFVENLEREDPGEKEAAKARALRVLFSFVRIEQSEILELGKDETPVNSR